MPFDVETAIHQAQLIAEIQGNLLELDSIKEFKGKMILLSDQLRMTLHQVEQHLDSWDAPAYDLKL